jgi:glycosyltransferase involved in cell wall biosynthesis
MCRLLPGKSFAETPFFRILQMKVLYTVTLFSALTKSVKDRKWAPQGVPTIYKMMEALDKSFRVKFILTHKNSGRDTLRKWNERKDKVIRLSGLKNPISVLAGSERFPAWFRRGRGYLRELRQMMVLWKDVMHFRPDLVYFDRANIWSASCLARFTSVPVVLRVMGVTPAMHGAVEKRRLDCVLQRWAYRAPFAAVICTQDGSGGELWLDRMFRRSVPRFLLLNGVNRDQISGGVPAILDALPKDRMKVLFLGRLERDKGCDEFVEAILKLKNLRRVHALIVGNGNREEALRRKIKGSAAEENFTFVSHLPHEKVKYAFEMCDVYVSLNRMGNLSNSNLEAISAGLCIIIPESLPEIGIDLAVDKFLPKGIAIRLPRSNLVQSLTEKLDYLALQSEERELRGKAIAKEGLRFIPSWDCRIDQELEILKSVYLKRKRWANGKCRSNLCQHGTPSFPSET